MAQRAGDSLPPGVAGERFAVRNSGAVTVVEGAGEHCCEYMTGGTVVVLGETGRNFGAGMTGGEAYVYDIHNTLERRYNPELIAIRRVRGNGDDIALKALVQAHYDKTGSQRARTLLEDLGDTTPILLADCPARRICERLKPLTKGPPKLKLKRRRSPAKELPSP